MKYTISPESCSVSGWQKLRAGCRHLVICCLLLALLGRQHTAWAQAPAWQTQMLLDGVEVKSFAVNDKNDVYIVGVFNSSISSGNSSIFSGYGTFLTKWEAVSQSFRWVEPIHSICYGPFVTGISVTMEQAALVAVQDSRVYASFYGCLLCFADNGNSATRNWAQSTPGSITALVVSGINLYISGAYYRRFTAGNTILNAVGNADIFVAKYVDTGANADFAWVWSAGGYEDDIATTLAVNGNNVYVAGNHRSRAALFDTTLIWNANQNSSDWDCFMAKLTDLGGKADFKWVITAGNPDGDNLQAITVENNILYVAADMFETSHPENTGTFGNISLKHHVLPLAVIARITDEGSTGRIDWINAQEGQVAIKGLATRDKAIYITGHTSNHGFVGGYPVHQPILSYTSFFLARLTDTGTTGKYVWARTIEISTTGLAVSTAGPTPAVYVMCLGSDGVRNGSFLASLLDDPATIKDYPTDLVNLSLFPNPASATTTLRLPTVPGATTATIRWYSTLGQLVRTQQVALGFPDTTLELSLTELAAGPYYLRIDAGDQHLTRTLVVQ